MSFSGLVLALALAASVASSPAPAGAPAPASAPVLAPASAGEWPQPASASEWPQWGGPRRSFTVPEPSAGTGAGGGATLAATWPATGPKVLWRRDLGEGYSGIAVAGGRLFTLTRRGEQEVVVALEAVTGKTVWEQPYDAPFSPAYDMSHGPGPHATPLVTGGKVFTTGATGKLNALDAASGRILWSHDLMAEFGGTVRVNGYACSPLAVGDAVIVQVGGKDHGVMAFRQSDGAIVWSHQDFANSASSPLLIDLDGETQLVAFTWGEVSGLDPKTGERLWSYPHVTEHGLNVSMPVWGEDHLLFISSAYGGGSRALHLTKTPAGTQVEEVWATPRMRLHFGNAVRLGDTVYGSSGDFGPAPYQALDVKTGRILWRDRSVMRASAIAVGDRLLLLDEDGNLTLATPGAEGLTVAARASVLASPAWTAPSLAGTTLYLRDRKVILALDLGTPQ